MSTELDWPHRPDAAPRGSGGRPRSQLHDVTYNVALLTALWLAYSAVRKLGGESASAAYEHAKQILVFESWLGLDIEQGVQALIHSPIWYQTANLYSLAHFPITIAFLIWAYAADRNDAFLTSLPSHLDLV